MNPVKISAQYVGSFEIQAWDHGQLVRTGAKPGLIAIRTERNHQE
jgi:hypothetical protein